MKNTNAHAVYCLILGLTIATCLVISIIGSVLFDPYRVFGLVTFNERNFEPNTRFLKIEHLKATTQNPEFFVFGTSRVNGYPVDEIYRLTGQSAYNMTAASETPKAILKKLNWLIQHSPPKSILIGLDFDELDQPSIRNEKDISRREHYRVSGQRVWSFYWDYLWISPYVHAINLYGNTVKENVWYYFDIETGHYHFPIYDQARKATPEAYIEERFDLNLDLQDKRPNLDFLNYLEEIIEVAQRHEIEVYLVNNPTNGHRYRSFNFDIYANWLRQIVTLGVPVWDFSGLNSVTLDDTMYYETSHFTKDAGRLALRRMFSRASPRLHAYEDFGTELTPQNIEQHIKNLSSQLN